LLEALGGDMTRYFFHIYGDRSIERDATGTDFESLEEAIKDATRARGEILQDEGWESCRIDITDSDGAVIAVVPQHQGADQEDHAV
jgi:hypothetical protein